MAAWGMAWAGPMLAMAQQAPEMPIRAFDPAHTAFGFEVRTRFGQRIVGVFPRYEGGVAILPDGRHQVRLRLFTPAAEIPDKPHYSGWMRSDAFFDANRFPVIEFVSQPFPVQLLHEGGGLSGSLVIRGNEHAETMRVLPASCERPGFDCDVVVRGSVLRSRYGMDNWAIALSDTVTFVLRSRLEEPATP